MVASNTKDVVLGHVLEKGHGRLVRSFAQNIANVDNYIIG
jgi:hypothetical protein